MCPGRGATLRRPLRQRALFIITVLCTRPSEVLIQECRGCFWKVSRGGSSLLWGEAQVEKTFREGSQPLREKVRREYRRKRMGSPICNPAFRVKFLLLIETNHSVCVYGALQMLLCVFVWLLSHWKSASCIYLELLHIKICFSLEIGHMLESRGNFQHRPQLPEAWEFGSGSLSC